MPSAPAPARASSLGPVYGFPIGSSVSLSVELPKRAVKTCTNMFIKTSTDAEPFGPILNCFPLDKTERCSPASSLHSFNIQNAYVGNAVF